MAAAKLREAAGQDVYYFNIGDPQAFGFRPPHFLIDVVTTACARQFTGYAHSIGLPAARSAVAEYATELGAETSPEDVVITAGASEAADLILTALLDPGDEVLVPVPGYPLYPAILRKLGAVPVAYHLDPKRGWRLSIRELAELANKRTRAIVLINPGNPTGSVTPDPLTLEVLELAEALNLLVISDEVYRELTFSKASRSASTFATESGAAIVTLESLSKTHILSGWRVGWMRFSNRHKVSSVVDTVTKLAGGRLCSPTPAQYAVAPALKLGTQFRENFVSDVRCRRDFAVSEINRIDGLSCRAPAAAFYLMVQCDESVCASDEEFVLRLLNETGIVAVPGSGFGCSPTDRYFRLVYLADREQLGLAIEKLSNFLSQPSSVSTAA